MAYILTPAKKASLSPFCSERQAAYCVALGKPRQDAELFSNAEASKYIAVREQDFVDFKAANEGKEWTNGDIRAQHGQSLGAIKNAGLPCKSEDEKITDADYDKVSWIITVLPVSQKCPPTFRIPCHSSAPMSQ